MLLPPAAATTTTTTTATPRRLCKRNDEKVVAAEKARQESIWQLLHEPGVQRVLLNFGWLYLVSSGYTVIMPLWWFTPIPLGGFGFSPLQISVTTAFGGVVQAVWLIVVFPPLQRRRGTNGVMRMCATAYPFFFTVAPRAGHADGLFARDGQHRALHLPGPVYRLVCRRRKNAAAERVCHLGPLVPAGHRLLGRDEGAA